MLFMSLFCFLLKIDVFYFIYIFYCTYSVTRFFTIHFIQSNLLKIVNTLFFSQSQGQARALLGFN